MKAIIPAAGYAIRLYPLTKDRPKHLIEVNGRAILEYLIKKLEEIEINEIFIVTNEKFYNNFREWNLEFKSKIPIKIINDKTTSNENRLGAIGDIKFVIEKEKIDDNFLVILGDNIFDFSLKEMYNKFKEKNKSVISLYDVKTEEEAKKFGVVSIDEGGKVLKFIEKPEEPESSLAAIGIYFYTKDVIKLINEYLKEGNNPDTPGSLVEWLHKKEEVYSYTFDSDEFKWFDIGSLKSLEEARGYFL